MIVQLSYKSNVQNPSYLLYIHILWDSYTPQIHSASSSSMARNFFLAFSIPIHLGLDASALASTIKSKQTLLDTRLWEHAVLINLVYEVSSRVAGGIEQKLLSAFIYFIFGWCCMRNLTDKWYGIHLTFDNLRN